MLNNVKNRQKLPLFRGFRSISLIFVSYSCPLYQFLRL